MAVFPVVILMIQNGCFPSGDIDDSKWLFSQW
jgi:hypothetical protein